MDETESINISLAILDPFVSADLPEAVLLNLYRSLPRLLQRIDSKQISLRHPLLELMCLQNLVCDSREMRRNAGYIQPFDLTR